MSLSPSRLLGIAGSGLAVAAFAFPFAAAVAQEEREIVIQRVVVEEKGEKNEKEEKEENDDDEKKASLWIGIALDGPEGADGLKIAQVYPDSPAQKAELKAGDLLIAANDKKLERVEQLVDLVQDSKGRELKIKLLREGREIVREVKPSKRPEAVRGEEKEEKEAKKEGDEKVRKRYDPIPRKVEVAPKAGAGSQGGSGTIHLYTVPKAGPGSPATGGGSAYPPGTMMPQPMTARLAIKMPDTQLPDDMEVTISKKGNRPAVVTARQGDKLWKTTEKELGMLPGPAQAYAARMLGHDVLRARTPGAAPGMGGAMMGMPGMPGMGGMSGIGAAGGMPGMPGMPGASPARREVRAIELRLNKDGKVEAGQEGKNAPNIKVLPGGGIQVEIREGAEGKEEKKEGKSEKPAADNEDADKARRIRQLQEQAEQLRALLNKLREEVKEKE